MTLASNSELAKRNGTYSRKQSDYFMISTRKDSELFYPIRKDSENFFNGLKDNESIFPGRKDSDLMLFPMRKDSDLMLFQNTESSLKHVENEHQEQLAAKPPVRAKGLQQPKEKNQESRIHDEEAASSESSFNSEEESVEDIQERKKVNTS